MSDIGSTVSLVTELSVDRDLAMTLVGELGGQADRDPAARTIVDAGMGVLAITMEEGRAGVLFNQEVVSDDGDVRTQIIPHGEVGEVCRTFENKLLKHQDRFQGIARCLGGLQLGVA